MMQMISAGGLTAVTDGLRTADPDNPLGYIENERGKRFRFDHAWLDEAQGKVIKIVHTRPRDLPVGGFEYRVIWMLRRMLEMITL